MNSHKDDFLEIFNSIDFNGIKDHPNILIAASFWEKERYDAAKICYRLMREIDDLIDDHKAANKSVAPGERIKFIESVTEWQKKIFFHEENSTGQKEIYKTIEKFRIPVWPMEAFARSMIYDINNNGFRTFDDFLKYAEGASVAPASIFVHLNSLIKKKGIFEVPLFDVREAATPCALFSYLVHIIRDFQKDQLNNLNYFADDLVARHYLTGKDLYKYATGTPADSRFRKLIGEYYYSAEEYRLKTFEMIRKVSPFLKPRYRLSLEIIFNLYLMVFERIDPERGSFTTSELNPTPEETKKRVLETILKFRTD